MHELCVSIFMRNREYRVKTITVGLFFGGNVVLVWIFFVNFVVEMLMDNRR